MTSFYKIIYRAFRVNQPHQANQNPNNWTYHKSSAYISMVILKKPEKLFLNYLGEEAEKFSQQARHQLSANMKNLPKLVGILLHADQMAIQNI